VLRRETTAELRIEKAGYAPVAVPLRRTTSAAISWDFVYGASALANPNAPGGTRLLVAIGTMLGTVSIDLLTGAAYRQDPGLVRAVLKPAGKQPDDLAAVR